MRPLVRGPPERRVPLLLLPHGLVLLNMFLLLMLLMLLHVLVV
jgi:hypothetical protein